MKQVIARAGKVEVVEVPAPVCGPGDLLVRTVYSLISSGTESWTIGSTEPIGARDLVGNTEKLRKAFGLVEDVVRKEGIGGLNDYVKAVRKPQVSLGYSLSGVVLEVGKDVTDFVPGDRVACAGEGKACHAEFVAIPRNLACRFPNEVRFRDASFATVGAIAVHGYRRSEATLGETIGVIGAGLVGNVVIQVAKAAGCNVVAIEPQEGRLKLATESGADLALSPNDPLLESRILTFTEGRGLDRILICAATGSSDPVNLASRIARDKASITIVGRVGMEFDRKNYYQKELDIQMSRSLGPGRYDLAYEEGGMDYPASYVRWTLNRNMDSFLKLLGQKKLNVELLIGETRPVNEAGLAYAALESSTKVAVLLEYGANSAPTHSVYTPAATVPSKNGRINVALVGPGNYAKEILIPMLRSGGLYNLRWVVSSSPLHSKQLAERYHFEKFGTSYNDILSDPQVELVMITTPNNLHYQMVLDAIKAGKPVFVEKPLCISEDELRILETAYKAKGGSVVVGFNRRYAPLTLALRKAMLERDGPFLLNYRVNADFIPMNRWTQDPGIGGGRIIAECCHFFDLFNFLLGTDHPQIQVTSTGVNKSTVVTRDNLVFVLKYPDGSVASLSYSALGNRTMERERLEVFGQGTAFVLEDFKRLSTYGQKGVSRLSERSQDKGHAGELRALARMMRGDQDLLVSFEDAAQVTRMTFSAEQLARSSVGLS